MKDSIKILVLYIVLLISVALLFSCNSVKRVIKDREKLDKVAEVVIRLGYCANDTIVYIKTDTLIKSDTTYLTDIKIERSNDTVYFWEQHYNTINKRIYIRDTVKSVIVDNAQLNVYNKNIAVLEDKLKSEKEKSKKRFKYLFVLITVCSLYILYKIKKIFIR